MKILAFSDWRVQDIEHFIDYLGRLDEKIDVIVYAGDDIRRFNRVEYEFLPSKVKKRIREQSIKNNESYGKLEKKTLEDIIRQSDIEYKSNVNKFEKIAKNSKYGLCVVAGNDDPPYLKRAINGKNVYDVHDTPFIIDDFAIIGVEGSTGTIGSLLYTEQEIKSHLKNRLNQVGDKQIIILSHSPPYKILDFAIRFSKDNIGSISLRDFIEKNTDKIRVVISGHVHLQGGKAEKCKDTYVVNCASHDNYGAPGRVAMIDISHDKVDINWEPQYSLQMVPLVGPANAKKLRENGILHVNQLAALTTNTKLSQKVMYFPLIIKYAKAIISNEMIIKKGIKSKFDNIEKKNIYFFDAEYDPMSTSSGPYGIFILGWMDRNGNVQQLFLDNPKDEKRMLKDFAQWVEREKPLFIAYGSNTADVPHLRNSYTRFNLSTTFFENSFFDLYSDLLYTRNKRKQKYFLPVAGSCGLKEVSEFLGYPQSDLAISHGIEAPIEYEKFLRKKREKSKERIKNNLLIYNQDDLKRTKFIFDLLKTERNEN